MTPNEDISDKTGNTAAGAIYSNKKTYEEYVTPPGSVGYSYSDLEYYTSVLDSKPDDIKVDLNQTKTHTSYGNPFHNGKSKVDANGTDGYPASEVIKDYENNCIWGYS